MRGKESEKWIPVKVWHCWWSETSPCSVTYSNYDKTEGRLLRETLKTYWRTDSVSSPPSFSLCVFLWQRSILHWTFSIFALALYPTLVFPTTHTHTSCLALSFTLTISATTTVSHSLWSHVLSIISPSAVSLTLQYLVLSTPAQLDLWPGKVCVYYVSDWHIEPCQPTCHLPTTSHWLVPWQWS